MVVTLLKKLLTGYYSFSLDNLLTIYFNNIKITYRLSIDISIIVSCRLNLKHLRRITKLLTHLHHSFLSLSLSHSIQAIKWFDSFDQIAK